MRRRQSSVCFLRLEDQSIQPIHHGLIPLEEDRAGAQQDDGKAEDAHCGNVDPRGGGDAQQPCDQDVGVRGEENVEPAYTRIEAVPIWENQCFRAGIKLMKAAVNSAAIT